MPQLLDLLISPVFADTPAAPTPTGGGYSLLIMFLVFFAFMYFAVWRPQNKRAKEQQQLIDGLAKGDEVITTAGILGRITKVKDQYIGLTLANNVEIVMQKASVSNVLPKGTIKSIE